MQPPNMSLNRANSRDNSNHPVLVAKHLDIIAKRDRRESSISVGAIVVRLSHCGVKYVLCEGGWSEKVI